ncbi:major capsid protein [Lacimonas salitolerans]|uniref:Major capsid protein n=1 Tax=Lacimonas salitolerans TaxID=1323750 RepID=A0ABW4EDB9_9RHOB
MSRSSKKAAPDAVERGVGLGPHGASRRGQALIENVEDSMGGLSAGAVQIRAECGSAFFANLAAHKEVRETYLNTAAAADLRGRVADEVSFGGITFLDGKPGLVLKGNQRRRTARSVSSRKPGNQITG